MAHARLCKQLKSRADSQSCSECAVCHRYCGVSSAPPTKTQASQMWSGRCSGCLFWFCAWNLSGTSQPRVLPPAFPVAQSAPSLQPLFQLQPASSMALLSIQPGQSTSRPPQNLWASWIEVSDPSPLGKLFLAISTCSHAHILPPSSGSLHWRM